MDKILVTRATLPPIEEFMEEIKSIWDNRWLTNMGDKHIALQKQLETFLKVTHVELMVNGHMALELAIQAFDLKGEVITSPFTFASTTHAIVRNGLKPVFADIKESDCTLDPEQIEGLITNKTCAILPVHVYGNICDIKAIEDIAQRYNLKVIYDAAHAFGEEYDKIGVGNYGDASMFSFHATKVFNSIEGGCVCFSENEYKDKLYNLKNFGIRSPEVVEAVGANAKMNEFQAAMGICNLRHIEENIQLRKKIVNRYQARLGGVKGIKVWHEQPNVKHNYSYFPIFIDDEKYGMDRDALFDILDQNGIGTRKYFYPLTSCFDVYKEMFDVGKTPVAFRISNQVMTLPLYPDLQMETVDYICDIISDNVAR